MADPVARDDRLEAGGDGAASCRRQHEEDPVLERLDGEQADTRLRGQRCTVLGLAGGVDSRVVRRFVVHGHRFEIVEPQVVALADVPLFSAAPKIFLNAQVRRGGQVRGRGGTGCWFEGAGHTIGASSDTVAGSMAAGGVASRRRRGGCAWGRALGAPVGPPLRIKEIVT